MKVVAVGLALAATIVLPGRSTPAATDERVTVVATTGIVADLTRRVAGDHVHVVGLVPPGADPHSYEPTLRDVRDIVHARLAFSNYLMLEEQSLIRAIDANLPDGARHIALAEEASGYSAEIIPLVENHSLDTVWLGLRVAGSKPGATRAAAVEVAMVDATGPGGAHGFVTGTFGRPDSVFNSADGFDAGRDFAEDSTSLPLDAHTHMSWAFTEPGLYRLHFRAQYRPDPAARPRDVQRGELLVAVGVDPGGTGRPVVLTEGHADLTVNLDTGRLEIHTDRVTEQNSAAPGMGVVDLDRVVISVPPKALMPVPADPAYRFIERPGRDVYQLPQAVLGKHVHGEIDPHLWQDVRNAQAYLEVIRDQLIAVDPAHAGSYRANAADAIAELDEVHEYVTRSVASIPRNNRHLVTTHDGYGYLAHRYGLSIAAVVAPSPAQEPSLADRRRLSRTLDDLGLPAVFLEPNASRHSTALVEAAHHTGTRVCRIWGDAFTPRIATYPDLMRANADSLARCLGGTPLGENDLKDDE
ncbi:MAG: anchored repeat ABC transporter, substrate-binding protein [Propionibacterium sp.]|nr:anchored repeat ABC transporter, substrate-binding protein [Propionibacterium sp.]